MKVLFLTLANIGSIEDRDIYPDLLRCFRNNGHDVFIIAPESNLKSSFELIEEDHAHIVHVCLDNLTKSENWIRKGVAQVLVGPQFKRAIKLYFSDVKFDLILYSTPPITLVGAIEYVKKRDNAKSYLLLKDIFPQNAVDIDLLCTTGIKGLLYKHFRKQEKRLYRISDRIGCMSQANVDYVIKHNPEIDPSIVEICPNSIEVIDKSVDEKTRIDIRNKYGIPLDKKVFVYGGNLGKPQGVPFLIECLKKCEEIEDAVFLIVGDGTEYHLLEEYVKSVLPKNVKLMRRLPKDDYDNMVGACDVGMIFLDHRFTIPNFPSRLLSYMQAKIPVLAVTDPNTDIGKVITEGGFGWWCESNDSNQVENDIRLIISVSNGDIVEMGKNGFEYSNQNYHVRKLYMAIKTTCV